MCLICLEFDKQAMNFREARRALGEMRQGLPKDHVAELESKLDAAERAEKAAKAKKTTP